MEKLITSAVVILMIPLLLLNLFGGIFSGIWLAFAGEWSILFIGLIYAIFSLFFITLLMIPYLGAIALAGVMWEKKNALGSGFAILLSQSLLYALYLGLGYVVFYTVLNSAESSTSQAILLIWAFAIASGPWTYMAGKDGNDGSSQLTNIMLQFGLVIAGCLILFSNYTVQNSFQTVIALSIIPVFLTSWYAFLKIRNSGEILLADPYYQGRFTRNELFAYMLLMIHVAAADGKLHAKETLTIREIFKELTGERISKQYTKRFYNQYKAGVLNYTEFPDDMADQIAVEVGDEMKEVIIIAASHLVKSDGDISGEEKGAISEISGTLGLTKKDVSRILKESRVQI